MIDVVIAATPTLRISAPSPTQKGTRWRDAAAPSDSQARSSSPASEARAYIGGVSPSLP